jgi:hypothetical protein
VQAAGSAANRTRLVENAIEGKIRDAAERSVVVAGSAANRARLATNAIQNRAGDVLQAGNAVQDDVGEAVLERAANLAAGGVAAAGLERFANATRIVTNAPAAAVIADAAQQAGGVVEAVNQVDAALPNTAADVAAAVNGQGLVGEILQVVDATQPQLEEIVPAAIGAAGVAASFGAGAVSGGGGGAAPTYVSQPSVLEAPGLLPEETAPAAGPDGVGGATGEVDLVLEDLSLAAPATKIAGPAYRLKFRNQGTAAATSFHVVMLAGLGVQPTAGAPRAIVQVPALAAGEVIDVMLRLPASAINMAGADGRPRAMTHLFVALDFADAIAEVDELNNLAIVEADALETAMR